MNKFNRDIKSEPNYLKNNKKELVCKYIESNNFDYSYGKNAAKLRKDLNKLTDNHCAYCDGILLPFATPQIDHFKPKIKYKLLAYSWINLFPVCVSCNNKKAKTIFKIRPDATNYFWKNYFWYENTTGIICAKTKDAQFIIDTLKLNSFDKIEYRLEIKNINFQPYRYTLKT